MGIVAWVSSNWFQLIQSTSIVAGLVFAGLSWRRDSHGRRLGHLIAIKQEHRQIWAELSRHPDLTRVLDEKADLVGQPPTIMETQFLTVVIVHIATSWDLCREGRLFALPSIREDVRSLLALPIPRFVWNQVRDVQEPRFAEFVDSCLENH